MDTWWLNYESKFQSRLHLTGDTVPKWLVCPQPSVLEAPLHASVHVMRACLRRPYHAR